jgi:glycerophosphoryl diester phosphodiesterase
MARLIAWGVDGLITDRPDLAPAEARAGSAGAS